MSQKRALLVLCYFGLIEMTKLATKMNTSFIIWQNLVRLSEVLALSLVFLFDLISLVLFSTLSLANHCMDDFFIPFQCQVVMWVYGNYYIDWWQGIRMCLPVILSFDGNANYVRLLDLLLCTEFAEKTVYGIYSCSICFSINLQIQLDQAFDFFIINIATYLIVFGKYY